MTQLHLWLHHECRRCGGEIAAGELYGFDEEGRVVHVECG